MFFEIAQGRHVWIVNPELSQMDPNHKVLLSHYNRKQWSPEAVELLESEAGAEARAAIENNERLCEIEAKEAEANEWRPEPKP